MLRQPVSGFDDKHPRSSQPLWPRGVLIAAAKRIIKSLVAPASVLGIAGLALWLLPAEARLQLRLLPLVILPIGILLGLWFNRGRAFLGLISLFLACVAYALAAQPDAASFAERAVVTGVAVFVPLNFALILALPERGVLHFRSYRWLLLLIVESVFIAWVASAGHSPLSGLAWQNVIDHWLLRPDPTPLPAQVLFAAGAAFAVGRIHEDPSPVEIGLAGALLAFFIGCTWSAVPGGFSLFAAAAGLMLLLSVLQESHRMAFRDELTGLPGRRMLEEQLLGLGPVFTIAMVDVDHFKKFNDAHGHDVGDQVLRMVGTRLGEVGGGGRAFRYGGEEFAVVFADTPLAAALPHLEQLRATIENYALSPRGRQRRHSDRHNTERRAVNANRSDAPQPGGTDAAAWSKTLSVTVSVGVAERNRRLHTSAMVLRAADEALYSAKHDGRNRVSAYQYGASAAGKRDYLRDAGPRIPPGAERSSR